MINFKGKVINIYRSCFFVTLKEQIRCNYQDSHHQIAKVIKSHYKCAKSSTFLNQNNSTLWKGNSYLFGTLLKNLQKKSQSFQNHLNNSSSSNLQQQDQNENKKISQQFENFIFDLQQIHQTDFENYEKITHIIDKYINQKILAYSLQKQNTSSDSQSLTYFFQNQKLLSHYTTALNIKSSVDFRFRKYDQILTNIENQLYLLKFLKVQDKVQKTIQKLCNMYIFVLVLHDHDKLKDVLSKNYNRIQTDERNQNEEKVGGRRVSRRLYEGPKQKDEELDQHQNKKKKVSETSLFKSLKLYMKSQSPQCLLSRALAFAVLGEVEQSLSLFCQLLTSDRQNKIIMGNFLSVLIFYGNQKFVVNRKGYVSSSVKEFVKGILSKREATLTVKTFPVSLSPQDAEYLLNSVLSFIKDQPLEWTDLPFTEIQQFSHSIYLIAENYYLVGQKQKAIKIIEDLKSKIQNKDIKFVPQSQRKGRRLAQKTKVQSTPTSIPLSQSQRLTNLEMLIQFFQLMRLYDYEDFSKIKDLQHQFSTQQKQNFYKFSSIPNDILRSNCYEIFSQTYLSLKDDQKAEEYQQLSLGNHCVNNTYQINQLGDIDSEISENNPKDMQKKNKGIPPHYFNLSRFLSGFEVKFN